MSIESKADLAALKRVGRIVALILAELRPRVVPGVTTAAIDRECAAPLARYGPHDEHTMVVTPQGPLILTALDSV
jgi:methionine aminopeptidase